MRRREFIAGVGSTVAWPLAARAQQRVPIVGFLSNNSPSPNMQTNMQTFRQGLGEIGYVEGRNVAIEYRWAESHYERLSALVADLVRLRVAVLFTSGGSTTRAAIATAPPMPIVFIAGADPVELGLDINLNRAGGNLTGVTTMETELLPKRVELLHELVPAARSIALLVNPTSGNAEAQVTATKAAASALGLQLNVFEARMESEIDAAFPNMVKARADALVIATDGFFGSRIQQLALLATHHAFPTASTGRAFAAAGGLVSYGPLRQDTYRTAGVYAGRILKGEKPADLPIMRPTKFELVINLTVAKALGLTVPQASLAVADEVIE
jgi:putative ABC transport system substrate-binding protein